MYNPNPFTREISDEPKWKDSNKIIISTLQRGQGHSGQLLSDRPRLDEMRGVMVKGYVGPGPEMALMGDLATFRRRPHISGLYQRLRPASDEGPTVMQDMSAGEAEQRIYRNSAINTVSNLSSTSKIIPK